MELPYFISIHTRVASFALHTRHHLQHWRRLEGVARSAGLAPHGGLGALPRAPRFGLAAAVLQNSVRLVRMLGTSVVNSAKLLMLTQ